MSNETMPPLPELPIEILTVCPGETPDSWFDSWEENYIQAYAQAYAAQVVMAEREACASWAECYDLGTVEGHEIAKCIRARGKP